MFLAWNHYSNTIYTQETVSFYFCMHDQSPFLHDQPGCWQFSTINSSKSFQISMDHLPNSHPSFPHWSHLLLTYFSLFTQPYLIPCPIIHPKLGVFIQRNLHKIFYPTQSDSRICELDRLLLIDYLIKRLYNWALCWCFVRYYLFLGTKLGLCFKSINVF